MRLKEIKQTLEEVIPQLKISAEGVTINGSKFTRLSNLKEIRKAILKLIANNVFFEFATKLWDTEISNFSDDQITLDPSTASNIVVDINKLEGSAREFYSSLQDIVLDSKENTVYIKLATVNDLNDLSNTASVFSTIFSQIILEEEIGGQIKIESVENGSVWIEVFVGSIKAVSIIGAIAYSAALAFREIQKGLYISESRRTRKLDNDKIEYLQTAQKLLLDDLIDAEAHHINAEYFTKDNPERIARIKNVIGMLSEEMNKGAEVRPSLKASLDTTKLFPDMKNLLTMVSRIKEITNKKSEDSDTKKFD